MANLGKGILAGLIATVVLSIVMIIKTFMHLLPAFNAIEMIHSIVGGLLVDGWIGHFVIGVLVWGLLFSLLYDRLPGSSGVSKGLVFAIGAWLAMMIVFMPAAGAGFFGLAIGAPVVLATLVLHLIYGAVLGGSYAGLGGA